LAELWMKDECERTAAKQRLIDEFSHAAKSWPHERRVITRLEWGEQGGNPRFIAPTSAASPKRCTTRCTASAAKRKPKPWKGALRADGICGRSRTEQRPLKKPCRACMRVITIHRRQGGGVKYPG